MKEKPLHILYIAPNRMRGGSVILRYTVRHMLKQGHCVTVLIPQEGLLAQILREMGATVWIHPLAGWRIFFLKPWNGIDAWFLARKIKKNRIDIVDINNYKLAGHGILAARFAKIPAVVYVHDHIETKKARKFGLHHAAAVVCVSDHDAATLKNLPPPVRTIYPGTDCERFRPGLSSTFRAEFNIAPDDFVVVSIGEVVRIKGYEELFAAASQLVKKFPKMRFVIVGGYRNTDLFSTEEVLRKTLRQNGLEAHVVFAGFRSDIPNILASANLFLMPSHLEMFPSVILEAMATGVPVIATAVGGIPEMIVSNVHGLLIPPRSSQAIVQAVSRLSSDPSLCERFKQAALRRVKERFSIWEKTWEKEALYRECLAGQRQK